MYVRVNRETKFATMAEKFRGKGCSFKYLSFFSTCVRRYFAWNGKLNIHSDVIRKKNWLARFVDWKIDRFHEDNGQTEYFIRTEAKVKQIFDGEKKKKKELSLGFEKFSPIDAKLVDIYTPKKKKRKPLSRPTNYSFFSAFNLRNNRRRGYFALRERGEGGGKKNRMIFKRHVDKKSLGLHFLRNFQVCLFSYSVPCCAVEKNFESMFYKNMQRKGLEGKEEKFNVCKITSRNFLLYQRYRDSPTKLRSIEFKISPVKWFLSRNLHLARGHLWILKGIEPLNRLVPGY